MLDCQDILGGLDPGARVVVRHPHGPTLGALLTACLDTGLVAVPLHPRAADRDVAETAERVSASMIVGAGTSAPVEAVRLDGRPDHPEAEGLALIMFTSGSTGRPKGVKLSRDAVLGNARKTAEIHGLTPDRPHGTCLPLYHCNALVMSLYGTHLTGSPLVLHEWDNPAAYFAALAEGGARTASIVPAMLADLVEAGPDWPDSLEYLITAAAPMSSHLAGRFHERYGPRIRQGFGLTESINFSLLMPLLGPAEFVAQCVEQVPPVGLPVAGTEVRIVDGEVWLRSAELMDGYWEDEATTAGAIDEDGWLHSGDLGELRDGYLVLRGRRTEQVNRGGEKYYPLDLEERWRRAGLSGSYAAVPVPEPSLGHEIGLVLADGPVERTRDLVSGRGPRPVVVQSGDLAVTSTRKPRRTYLGRRLAVRRDSGRRYEELLHYAVRSGEAVLGGGCEPESEQARHLHGQIQRLVSKAPASSPAASGPRTAAHDALDLLVEFWPKIAAGDADGDDLMHAHRGLWSRLMTEWPMLSYAELVADVLVKGEYLTGRVLELGSGVGNTTSLVADGVDGEFVWSDRVPALVERGGWPGRGVVYDLDAPPPSGLGDFDTIFATNVLHCVADPARTIRELRTLLRPGGRLVLSEGTSPTNDAGLPWALDHLFSLWPGWWDRGGFRSRWDWLATFESERFTDRGFSALRAGEHDLGGVVWGRR